MYSVKKVFLEISQNLQENTYTRVSILIKLQARSATLLKQALAQVFSCEFCEISKNNFSYRLPLVAASAACNFIKKEIPAKIFFCEFGKISKNIFWQSTSGWVLLKLICDF